MHATTQRVLQQKPNFARTRSFTI